MASPRNTNLSPGSAGQSCFSRSASETASHSSGSHRYQSFVSNPGSVYERDRGSSAPNSARELDSVCEGDDDEDSGAGEGVGGDLNAHLPMVDSCTGNFASIDDVISKENNVNDGMPGDFGRKIYSNSQTTSASTSFVKFRQEHAVGIGIRSHFQPFQGMNFPKRFDTCCDCILTQNRCGTEMCLCYREKQICDEHCESNRYRGDCLNQAICICSCDVELQSSDGAANGRTGSKRKQICSKADKCECVRLREGCNILCKCKQICKNRELKKIAKTAKPKKGCTCAKSRKQCVKKDCPCRASFEFCSAGCKCQNECVNSQSKYHIPKNIQSCFLEHKTESSGLILTLLGENYTYRTEFYHDCKSDPHVEEQLVAAMYELLAKQKLEIQEIVIYISKSPCFHQDCDPKCEVVEECKANKACSKLLAILLSKVRKELGNVDIKMNVRFLFPHLHRGDLYTKQGVLCMMQSGITVEPLLMKDWGAIMDWCILGENVKGDYLKLWNQHQLDKGVALSQAFINECRRTMGLSLTFWVAEIHEIVKNTIINCTDMRYKLGELNDGLKQLDLTATPSKIRSTPSKRRSFIDIIELKERMMFTREPRSKNLQSGALAHADDAATQQMVASFCGRSFDDTETDEIAQRIRQAMASINLEIESLMEFLHVKGNY